jgi:hypothetical protein
MDKNTSELLTVLHNAVDGLEWISESNAPFSVFSWHHPPDLTDETVLELTQHPFSTPIERLDPASFFDWATQEQDWHSAEDRAIVHRYQALVAILNQHLHNLTVYRLGDITLDLYIVGETSDGEVIGLATQAVET